MAEWGNEEQLLSFGREAVGVLGEEGLRRPSDPERWADVLAIATKDHT
jgi:hypothetical protein